MRNLKSGKTIKGYKIRRKKDNESLVYYFLEIICDIMDI